MRKLGRAIGLLVAAVLLLAFASSFLIRKTCCSEQLDEEEIRELERAATNGDVATMMRLHRFFGESEQPEKAAVWLQRAADAGDAQAELHLFSSLERSDERLAMSYLHRSAEHGSSLAQGVLAARYRDGDGVAKNIETAKYWFQRGARAGDIDSILAWCDMAAAERDLEKCRECIVLQDRAKATIHPQSYFASQLRAQRERIENILNGQSAR